MIGEPKQIAFLGHDGNRDVANYVGYAYRKLGDYDLSQVWYEEGPPADPNHVRTWEYRGLAARAGETSAKCALKKIGLLRGNLTCQKYVDLNAAIEEARDTY